MPASVRWSNPDGQERAPPFFASTRKGGDENRSLRVLSPAGHFRQTLSCCREKRGRNHPKTDVVVPVVRVVPVAEGAAHVVLIVVERAATQHTQRLRARPYIAGRCDRGMPVSLPGRGRPERRSGGFQPTAEQSAHLGRHFGHVPILTA